MKDSNVPIVGFNRYKLNLISQEITNGRGKIMKQRYDGRGTLITNLVDNDGKQRTVIVRNLVENTVSSLEITEGSALILSDVLMAYYEVMTPEMREVGLMDVSRKVRESVPHLEILEIGRILSRIH